MTVILLNPKMRVVGVMFFLKHESISRDASFAFCFSSIYGRVACFDVHGMVKRA